MSDNANKEEAIEMIIMAKEWFENRIKQLKLIADAKDPIVVQGANETDRIEVKGEALKGLKLGVITAIDIFGEFPIKITKDEEE